MADKSRRKVSRVIHLNKKLYRSSVNSTSMLPEISQLISNGAQQETGNHTDSTKIEYSATPESGHNSRERRKIIPAVLPLTSSTVNLGDEREVLIQGDVSPKVATEANSMEESEPEPKRVKKSSSIGTEVSSKQDDATMVNGEIEVNCKMESIEMETNDETRIRDGTKDDGSNKNPSASTESALQQFEVERILDYSKNNQGAPLYLVKWKGWDSEHNTWEPAENVIKCETLLLEFYLLRKAEAKFIEETVEYTITSNGHKRRKGPKKLLVPPDMRPLEIKKRDFYQKTIFPEDEEIDEWKVLWENLIELERARKNAKDTIRWQPMKLNQVLDDALDKKLSEGKINKLRGQLLFHEFDQERKKIMEDLKVWELEINAITEGKPQITVENNVDLEGRPENFIYVNDYVASAGIHIPDDPPVGCSCPGLCQDNKKECCAALFGYQYPYTHHRKLRVSLGTPIYECNKKCQCGPECTNRLVQNGRDALVGVKLCIYRTSNGCGWGAKTLKSIKKGSFVTLYTGEVIKTEEAERRGREYDGDGATYLFDLDFNEGDFCPYTVDATKYGNIAHFFNHSCDPNLGVFSVWVNCLDPNLPKIALFALRDIRRGEELTFDYKQNVDLRQAREIMPPTETLTETGDVSEEHFPDSSDKIQSKRPCLCGSEKCRKFLF